MQGSTASSLETSWLRVRGPQDSASCAWCRRWVGRVIPLEMQATFVQYHDAKATGHACRCSLEREQITLDAEDPGCAWA